MAEISTGIEPFATFFTFPQGIALGNPPGFPLGGRPHEGMLLASLSGVDETDVLKKKAQSMLPDLNLVLEQLKSGNEGSPDSSVKEIFG